MMQENVPDSQIRYTLNLGLRQYQYFARRIKKKNQKIWRELVKGELASELLRLRSSIENSYQTALSLLQTPGLDIQDTLAILRSKDSMRSDIINLLVEGTQLRLTEEENHQPKYHKSQSKIMMQQLQPHP
jgi:hypothetical protein